MTNEQKLRLLQEYIEVTDRHRKLNEFLTLNGDKTQLECPHHLLVDQLSTLYALKWILKERLRYIGIEVK